MKNVLASNSNILIKNVAGGRLPPTVIELSISLSEWGIAHDTLIPDEVKLKYVYEEAYNQNTKAHMCAVCKEEASGIDIAKRKVKLQSVWDIDGYYEHTFSTPEEKRVLVQIILKMREQLFHGQYVCSNCPAESDYEFTTG